MGVWYVKIKRPVFGPVLLSETSFYGAGGRSTFSVGSGGKDGRERVPRMSLAVCWIPHDSNDRINWSCILSGFNATYRVCDVEVELAWSILTRELPYCWQCDKQMCRLKGRQSDCGLSFPHVTLSIEFSPALFRAYLCVNAFYVTSSHDRSGTPPPGLCSAIWRCYLPVPMQFPHLGLSRTSLHMELRCVEFNRWNLWT